MMLVSGVDMKDDTEAVDALDTFELLVRQSTLNRGNCFFAAIFNAEWCDDRQNGEDGIYSD